MTLGGLQPGEKYIISEINIPEGYELVGSNEIEITVEKNKTIEVTFNNRAETVDVSGTKTWDDKDNQDGIRPTEITVKLLKNGVEFKEVKVNDTNGWKYSFNDLDKYENGKEIEYTIIEDEVEGYSTIINGYNITNVHETEETIVSGVKTWNDSNNQDGIRPDSITVNLLKNGVQFKSIEVTKENDWSYKFENLAMYENGKKLLIR
ncbi:MAG: Cna B-type domain-containing protein [Bacilli bacterium]|nr:Cna B-type domain-containing protein [Bacilli bacterium]